MRFASWESLLNILDGPKGSPSQPELNLLTRTPNRPLGSQTTAFLNLNRFAVACRGPLEPCPVTKLTTYAVYPVGPLRLANGAGPLLSQYERLEATVRYLLYISPDVRV